MHDPEGDPTPRDGTADTSGRSGLSPWDHAWLWHAEDVGEYLLTRREAAVLDVIRRAGSGGVVTGRIAAAIQEGARCPGGPDSRPRGDAPRLRMPSFYAVLESLEGKGLVEVVGSERASGRPARCYGLTEVGEDAAKFASAVASRMVEARKAAAMARDRLGGELLTLLVDTRCAHAVVTSDGGGYRVDKVHDGRYLTVSEGPPEKHTALLTWLRDRAGLPPEDNEAAEGSFAHRTSDGRGVVQVAVRVTREVVGHRTTIALRPA